MVEFENAPFSTLTPTPDLRVTWPRSGEKNSVKIEVFAFGAWMTVDFSHTEAVEITSSESEHHHQLTLSAEKMILEGLPHDHRDGKIRPKAYRIEATMMKLESFRDL